MTVTITEDPGEFLEAAGPTGRLAGFDLGTRTLGLATCDVNRSVATGLTTLKRDKFSKLRDELSALLAQHGIMGLVIGLPRNMDGSSGPRVQATRAFARNLAAAIPLPQLLWDERLTTAEAERMLIAADASRRRRAEVIDQVAATLILQNAIERLRRLRT